MSRKPGLGVDKTRMVLTTFRLAEKRRMIFSQPIKSDYIRKKYLFLYLGGQWFQNATMTLTDFKSTHLIYEKSENESLIKQNESRCVDRVVVVFLQLDCFRR